jgi:hypothetical protein
MNNCKLIAFRKEYAMLDFNFENEKKIAKPPILNSAKKEEPNFLGQKYLICIFYVHYRKFGVSFSSVENSDYWISS